MSLDRQYRSQCDVAMEDGFHRPAGCHIWGPWGSTSEQGRNYARRQGWKRVRWIDCRIDITIDASSADACPNCAPLTEARKKERTERTAEEFADVVEARMKILSPKIS